MKPVPIPNARGSPELVPARMINEWVYCPRLAYLEWVQREWADSVDTIEGSFGHRRVDRPSGDIKQVEMDELDSARTERQRATSVELSSDKLGVIGRVDCVEYDGSQAYPIDYKHGRPPDDGEKTWDSDHVQICAQALLLREHGYQCELGYVYYIESKARVEVPISQDLVNLTVDSIAQLRQAADSGCIPEPLVDSTKCVRCSLVGICMPDEVNLMSGAPARRPEEMRRLIPARDNALPLYVQAQGAHVGKHEECLRIRVQGQPVQDVRLLDVSHLALLGNVQVTTQALREMCARGIPVCLHSYGGWFYGIVQSSVHKNVELRIAQYRVGLDAELALDLARAFVVGKIENQRTMIRRLHKPPATAALAELSRLKKAAGSAADLDSLLGFEGAAAKVYFGHFGNLLKPGTGFDYQSRNRRPPKDPVNAVLSFLYAMLVKDLTVTCLAVGFDPYLGFLHQPRYGRPSLALDLMEEFRPIICDSTALTMINKGELSSADFVSRSGGTALNERGRKVVLAAYERRMDTLVTHPMFGYAISYRRVLAVQARLLARCVTGEIPAYQSFCTR